MSRHLNATGLVRGLERRGLRFRSFTVASEGDWASEDADWNYKDVPHLNIIHTSAQTVPAATQDDLIATVNLQRMLGVTMPIALVNYVTPDGSQVYYTTLAWYVLVVETRVIGLGSIVDGATPRARVETTYHVAGPRWAMIAFPVLRRVLAANYRVLMSQDLPMRERRGRLRAAGYRFVSDGRPRTFAETTDLTVVNVVPPPAGGDPVVVDLGALGPGGTTMIGPGPDGLRFVGGAAREVLVFDRVCLHEGASLDTAELSGDCLTCPWHGRRVSPIATIKIDSAITQHAQAGARYKLIVDGARCTVTPLA